jgi:hypothetical protein
MSILSQILGAGDIVKAVGDTVDNLFTSKDEKMEKELEMLKAQREFDLEENKLIAQQNIAQTEVNKVEADSNNLFIAGWRPAIGWIGALALLYQFIIYPLLTWIPDIHVPKPIDNDMLWTIITGMLGIAGMRSYDKLKSTDTKTIIVKKK